MTTKCVLPFLSLLFVLHQLPVATALGVTYATYTTADATYPHASFMYSPSEPEAGEVVKFDAGRSYDPDGSIVSYEWDFGDGTKATGKVVFHVYRSPGVYDVLLVVTDIKGLKDYEWGKVNVKEDVEKCLPTELSWRLQDDRVELTGSIENRCDGSIVIEPGHLVLKLESESEVKEVTNNRSVEIGRGEKHTLTAAFELQDLKGCNLMISLRADGRGEARHYYDEYHFIDSEFRGYGQKSRKMTLCQNELQSESGNTEREAGKTNTSISSQTSGAQPICQGNTCNPEIYFEYPHSSSGGVSRIKVGENLVTLIPLVVLIFAALIGALSKILKRKP